MSAAFAQVSASKQIERRCDRDNQNCEEEKGNGFDWTTHNHNAPRLSRPDCKKRDRTRQNCAIPTRPSRSIAQQFRCKSISLMAASQRNTSTAHESTFSGFLGLE